MVEIKTLKLLISSLYHCTIVGTYYAFLYIKVKNVFSPNQYFRDLRHVLIIDYLLVNYVFFLDIFMWLDL